MPLGPDFTEHLSLPYLISNQAQKHVTLNESLRKLDALVHACFDLGSQGREHSGIGCDDSAGEEWHYDP